MRPCLGFFLLAVGFCPAGAGLAQEAPSAPPPAEVSERLDLLVRDAIDDGLLAPADAPQADGGLAEADAGPGAPAPSGPCAGADRLDFSAYASLSRYEDIYAYRAHPSGGDGPADGPAHGELVRAYLALGLKSEAMMALKQADDPESVAYRQLAQLLDNRLAPDIEYFRQQAACAPVAGLWLSVALLAAGEAEGAGLLRGHFVDFRRLPLQLRISVAAITLPALDGLGELTLAQRMMADFTAAELEGSSRLQFQQVLLAMSRGAPEAEAQVRAFLDIPHLQVEALTALLRNQRSIEIGEDDRLLDTLAETIRASTSDRDIAARLGFLLRELGARARYGEIIALSELPVLQNQAAQGMIRRELVSSLRRDLESGDAIASLVAAHALLAADELITDEAARMRLHTAATQRAARLGFASLAEKLAGAAETSDGAAAARAALAFRTLDDAALYALVEAHPGSEAATRLAALAAIRAGNRKALSRFETRLARTPETVLALIEADALAGDWLVSEAIYDAAAMLEDEADAHRAERVFAIREAVRAQANLPARVPIYRVAETLERSRIVLAQLQTEAR